MDSNPHQPVKNRWDWLPQHMPGIARLIKDKRRELGSAHVDECWKRGVVQGEPGWFFASEGALHVGTMWPDAMQAMIDLRQAAQAVAPGAPVGAPLLVLKPQEPGPHGTN